MLEVALANEIEPAGFGRSLVIAVLAGTALTLVCWAATRDRWLGGLLATALVVVTISLLPAHVAWEAVRLTFSPEVALAAFGLACFAVAALPVVFVLRARRGHRLVRGPLTLALNRVAAILVGVVMVVQVGPDLPGMAADALRTRESMVVHPQEVLPDIYILLLDGYPRADVLERRFGIDNTMFLDDLQEIGFDVAQGSHSNYVFTPLTLVSLFQMKHLDQIPEIAPLIGSPGAHINALRDAMVGAPAIAALRAAGYGVVVTLPGYEHVALRGAADRVLDGGQMNDLERDVLERTWLLDPLSLLDPEIFTGPPRTRIVQAFDYLAGLASERRSDPIFVWVHLPAPHLPLVLDARGDALPLDPRRFYGHDAAGLGMTDAQFVAAYADEIAYLNRRVLEGVRAVQSAGAGPPPVIILMSDHGYTTDLSDPQARFANLFAASTPGAPGLLAGGPTPVNLLPLLFNRFLGTDLPLSPDRYFLSPSSRKLLLLTEVADPEAGLP